MSLLDLITKQLGGNTMSRISREIGADEQATGAATTAALSTMIGALARNASSDDGARSLHNAISKDHDGGLLENLGGFLGKAQEGPGDGILKHVLGSRRPAVEKSLGKSTGLDAGSMGKLMTMLAPMVMGALGKQQREKGLGQNDLSQLLGQERRVIEESTPKAAGIFGKLLDTDHDGDVDISDLAKHGKGLLGKFLGGR